MGEQHQERNLMTLEEFKLSLLQQFKNEKSALHCLLSTPNYSERFSKVPSNAPKEPLTLYASDFRIKIRFEWQKEGDNHVYTMKFLDERYQGEDDICDDNMIEEKQYAEEVIMYRKGKIYMGLVYFKLKKEGYTFDRVIKGALKDFHVYDVKEGKFISHNTNAHETWLQERKIRMFSKHNVYLDLSFDDVEQQRFDEFCKDNAVSDELKQKLHSSLFSEYRRDALSGMYYAYLNLI